MYRCQILIMQLHCRSLQSNIFLFLDFISYKIVSLLLILPIFLHNFSKCGHISSYFAPTRLIFILIVMFCLNVLIIFLIAILHISVNFITTSSPYKYIISPSYVQQSSVLFFYLLF